jgi:hypothetical protein
MRYHIFVVTLLCVGCGPIRPDVDSGRSFSIEHGTARFQSAMAGAREHCARYGMRAKHVGTDRPYMAISRFECVSH